MELWIINKKRDRLIKVEHIFQSFEEIYAKDGDTSYLLGSYSSEKRTEEVFKEILNLMKPPVIFSRAKCFDFNSTETLSIINDDNSKFDIQQLNTYVYEMPKE